MKTLTKNQSVVPLPAQDSEPLLPLQDAEPQCCQNLSIRGHSDMASKCVAESDHAKAMQIHNGFAMLLLVDSWPVPIHGQNICHLQAAERTTRALVKKV